MYTTLITAQQLSAHAESFVIVDCRFDLTRPAAGRAAYMEAHIPGAVYAHLDDELSAPKSAVTGRHPLPDPAELARLFGRWGISSGSQVVAYDADTGMFASRLWWLLRWLGHRAVAVLDGGYKAWMDANLPVSNAPATPHAAMFVANVDPSAFVTSADVASRLESREWRLLDARAPERFRGEVEPIDPVAGHVPGARNHPFAKNMGAGRFLSPDELRRQYADSLDGIAPDRAMVMCGSGVTACHDLLAMEIAGLEGAKLYAGSWSEWLRDPSRPVATG